MVVSGDNPFDGLTVDPADIRRACEVQARSHLLHLREGFLETRGPRRRARRADRPIGGAVRGAAHERGAAAGLSTHDAAAAARHAERTLALPGGAVTDVVKLAHVSEISSAEATRLFPGYLDAVERLAKYVDGWSAA